MVRLKILSRGKIPAISMEIKFKLLSEKQVEQYKQYIGQSNTNMLLMKKLPLKIIGILILVVSLFPFSLRCQSPETNTFQNSLVSRNADPLIIHGIRQNFVRIPGGVFLMGTDERPDEQPVHMVRVNSFDLATTEVTVRQFRAFVQASCYQTDAETSGNSFACCWRPKLGITWLNPGFMPEESDPVVAISWNDATSYCHWLSEETGEEYRLPSEAEWEYAVIEGNKCKNGYQLDSIAWFSKNSMGRTHPVATRECNSLGLYDMLGNAWEWTQDVYHDNYKDAPSDGEPWLLGGSEAQRGYLKPGEGRVLRGGSWGLSDVMHPVSYDLRITSRPVFACNNSCNNSGFRVARTIRQNNQSADVMNEHDYSFTVDSILFEFVRIPPGQFLMGDEKGDRSVNPVHVVRFPRQINFGKTEITLQQFRNFVAHSEYITDAEKTGKCWDSDFRSQKACIRQSGLSWRNPGFRQSENDPVTCISWNDAMAFCNWLSSETGRIIRLPSEAEWEYACSDTTGTNYKSYQEIAWFYNNSGMTTHPVAGKKSNSNGLFDILGNVSEWMMDIWHPDYDGAPVDGSSRLGDPLTARVCRGGSFERESSEMSPRGRDWYDESETVVGLGFRIIDGGINPFGKPGILPVNSDRKPSF